MASNGKSGILNGCSTWRRNQFSTFRAIQPWVGKGLRISSLNRNFHLGISLVVVDYVVLFIAQPGGDPDVLYSKTTGEIHFHLWFFLSFWIADKRLTSINYTDVSC